MSGNEFHDLEMSSITGEPLTFSQYKGQACLIVNLASRWGLTNQYAGLRTLQEQFSKDGFTVLGFPCNQFGAQEPGSNEEVLEFAQSKYQVNFPMFAKVEVNGDGAADLFKFLKAAKADDEGKADIAWNFNKFLVSGEGEVVARWGPQVTPEDIGEQLASYL